MINWEVVTGDIPASSGLTQTAVDLAKSLTIAAADYWGRYIESDVTLTIELRLDTTEPVFGQPLEGSAFSTSLEHVFLFQKNGQRIVEPGATYEIKTGIDPNGDTPDIVITIHPDSVSRLALDPTPETSGDIKDVVSSDMIDFMSLMIHELGHSLGMTSFPVDTPLSTADTLTTFDQLSKDTSNGRFFHGETAQSVLGAPVPLTHGHIGLPIDSADDPFSEPDSLPSQLFRFDVFRDATFLGFRAFTSSLDLAILEDLGIPMVTKSPGDDLLYGFEREPDTIGGLAGNDTLYGLSGPDALWGGDGEDHLFGGSGSDTLGGGQGNDLLVGDSEDVILPSSKSPFASSGHDDIDVLYGGAGNDVLITGTFNDKNNNGQYDDGEAGTDQILFNEAWAGPGNDTVVGTDGDEILGGSSGNDVINGHGGADQIYGGREVETGHDLNDVIRAGSGNDTVFAGAANDSVFGGSGADILFNGTGQDTVSGGLGNDTLWGGPGDDQLRGDAGADLFAFGIANGNDTITDFTPNEDTLDIQAAELTDFDSLIAIATETGDGLSIEFSETSIFLQGISLSDLSDANVLI